MQARCFFDCFFDCLFCLFFFCNYSCSESEGHRIAAELMARLGIAASDLLTGAYAEMLPREA